MRVTHGHPRNRSGPAVPFLYSPQWRALRLLTLRRDHYRCTACGANVSGKGMARIDWQQSGLGEWALGRIEMLCETVRVLEEDAILPIGEFDLSSDDERLDGVA